MNKSLVIFIIGLIAGAAILYFAAVNILPAQMIETDKSKFGFETTVTAVEEKAIDSGWQIPGSYRLDKSLKKHGFDIKRVQVFSLCSPKHAFNVLNKDENKFVSSMMPCRLSIYETEEGEVYISKLNI